MDVLLRELRDGPGGIAVSRDTEIATKDVSIGCAPDQQVQLVGRTIGARHAVIRDGGRGPSITCLGGRRAAVNGSAVRSARLDIGDRIEIGGHQLTIAHPPAGFDLAIEVRPNADIDGSDFEAAFRTDLQQTWLGKRKSVWRPMGFVILFGFAVPFLASSTRRVESPIAAWASAEFPASALWSTGPLAPGHRQLMGRRCADCHQTLFTRVQDGACQACHKEIDDHVPSAKRAQTSFGPAERCAACHREHEEPAGNLVDRSDAMCVGCHADAHAFGALTVQAVSGFGVDRHPPFGPNDRLRNAAKDRSGLKFSHAQHRDGGRVRRSSDQKPLGCADCHTLSTDGEHFLPTTMAGNCVTCHELTFDPDVPDRQLPHGKPRDVVRTLQDYFARKLSDPNPTRGPTRERRRLPGHEDEVEEACTGSTFACAMRMAAREVQIEFERRGCVTCHQVKDTRNTDLTERFQVEPIRVVHDAFPAARFPHGSHLIQSGIGGDAACLSCHAAGGDGTGEMRLPDLPACLGCHSDTPSRDRTRLQCVSCHGYHLHK